MMSVHRQCNSKKFTPRTPRTPPRTLIPLIMHLGTRRYSIGQYSVSYLGRRRFRSPSRRMKTRAQVWQNQSA
jgi:hypothetical protein